VRESLAADGSSHLKADMFLIGAEKASRVPGSDTAPGRPFLRSDGKSLMIGKILKRRFET